MPKIPIDIKAVLDAATDIDAARMVPLHIAMYMDESAPGDIQGFAREAFATSAQQVRMSINYYPSATANPDPAADLAVIVAGLEKQTGKLAADIRAAGVPVMVVTTLPDIVVQLAESEGNPISAADIIAPVLDDVVPTTDGRHDDVAEPYVLTDALSAGMRVRMGEWVAAAFRERRLAFALAFPFVRKPLALEYVRSTSAQNAAIGALLFIPGADMPVMTLNQAKMLLQIAAAYGQPLDKERIKELVAVVGGGFACRSVSRTLVGIVPVLGWAIKASIGYAGTFAMGEAAIKYFEGGASVVAFGDVIAQARDRAVSAVVAASKQKTPGSAALAAVDAALGDVPARVTVAARNAIPATQRAVVDAVSELGVAPAQISKAVGTAVDKFSQHDGVAPDSGE